MQGRAFSKPVKAGAMLTVGALLIGGGATLATWDKATTGTDDLIQAGGMSLEIDSDVQVYDVSTGSVDDGHEIDPNTFEVVPGDTLRIIQDVDISLLGDNIQARLEGGFSGTAGGINFTSVVKLVNGIQSPTGAIASENVLAETKGPGSTAAVSFQPQGEYHYQVVREVTFPNIGKSLESVSASSIVDGSRWALTQTRRPPALGPSIISDPGLTESVRESLGLSPSQPVGDAEVASITHLDASNRGITSIAGLEGAVGLISMNVSGNAISDLAPIQSMKKLESLNVANNIVENIKPVEKTLALKSLNVSNNKISSVYSIGPLTKLKVLDISNNQIADISSLQPIKQTLTELSAHHNKIPALLAGGGSGWASMQKMDLSYNLLPGLIVLGNLPELVELNLGHNQMTSLSVAALKLRTFDGSYNKVLNYGGIGSATVVKFDGSHNALVTAAVGGLSKTENVEVNVSHNAIKSAVGIVESNQVGRKLSIDVTHNGLSNLSAFANQNPNLKVLNIGEGNSISNISPLAAMRNVEKIIFTGNEGVISDWSALSNLPEGTVIK